ncbi:hypothetical protein [Cellulosimicrobium aquatile]|uniref:hypothetical protein n=1 Tax=Cellulosimicrobium aquatile TaxID=1612203 RepID=UPI0014591E98|nr:hypothetical protein [Cellulosimicrobium aquatile]NMF28890.1 hypothetical protein [Cellulosimicrobium aquatile]
MPAAEGSVLRLDSIDDYVAHLAPEGVIFYGLLATLIDESREIKSDEPSFVISTAIRVQEDRADFRCEIELDLDYAKISVDAAATFKADAPTVEFANREGLIDFADNVAMMVLFPYLRQAVSDLGSRIGVEAMLPLLPRGAISFRPDVEASKAE